MAVHGIFDTMAERVITNSGDEKRCETKTLQMPGHVKGGTAEYGLTIRETVVQDLAENNRSFAIRLFWQRVVVLHHLDSDCGPFGNTVR